jgi:polyisoprenoid-binding protein YceI
MKNALAAAMLLVAVSSPAFAQNLSWTIDPKHSAAGFGIRHMMVSTVRGAFGNVSGTVEYDGKDPTKAAVNAAIDPSSINTREESRDKHLKGPDFFDVAKFPAMGFKSKKIVAAGEGKYKMIGDLNMHGVTKEVALDLDEISPPINDGHGNTRVGASATGKVNRKDFGITYGGVLDNGGAALGDDVTINLDIELTRPTQAASK